MFVVFYISESHQGVWMLLGLFHCICEPAANIAHSIVCAEDRTDCPDVSTVVSSTENGDENGDWPHSFSAAT